MASSSPALPPISLLLALLLLSAPSPSACASLSFLTASSNGSASTSADPELEDLATEPTFLEEVIDAVSEKYDWDPDAEVRVWPLDAGAVRVLDAQADLPDVAAALVARDGGVERDAAAEHDGEARHGVPREPLAVDGHGAAAGRVERAAGGRVEEDPAELEVGRRDGGRRRREALMQRRVDVDAERRAQEPVGGGIRAHDARQDAGPRVAQVDGRHEARGQGLRSGRGDGARDREGVGEQRPVVDAGEVADGGPHGEAERPPRGRVGGEGVEPRARAPHRRQRRAVEAAEHEGEDVRWEVLDGRAGVVAGRGRGFHRANTHENGGGRPAGERKRVFVVSVSDDLRRWREGCSAGLACSLIYKCVGCLAVW